MKPTGLRCLAALLFVALLICARAAGTPPEPVPTPTVASAPEQPAAPLPTKALKLSPRRRPGPPKAYWDAMFSSRAYLSCYIGGYDRAMIRREADFLEPAWVEAARDALYATVEYRAVSEADPEKRLDPIPPSFYDEAGRVAARFHAGVADDFDGDGRPEAFLLFDLPEFENIEPGLMQYLVFVSASGDARYLCRGKLPEDRESLFFIRYPGFRHFMIGFGQSAVGNFVSRVYSVSGGDVKEEFSEIFTPVKDGPFLIFGSPGMGWKRMVFWDTQTGSYRDLGPLKLSPQAFFSLCPPEKCRRRDGDSFLSGEPPAFSDISGAMIYGNRFIQVFTAGGDHCFERNARGFWWQTEDTGYRCGPPTGQGPSDRTVYDVDYFTACRSAIPLGDADISLSGVVTSTGNDGSAVFLPDDTGQERLREALRPFLPEDAQIPAEITLLRLPDADAVNIRRVTLTGRAYARDPGQSSQVLLDVRSVDSAELIPVTRTFTAPLTGGRTLTLRAEGHVSAYMDGAPCGALIDRILVSDGARRLQTLPFYRHAEVGLMQSQDLSDLGVRLMDFNFDGNLDIDVRTGLFYSTVYLWNPASGLYEESDLLGSLPLVSPDPATQTVRSLERAGAASHSIGVFRWEGGTLVMERMEIDNGFLSDFMAHFTFRRKDGQMRLTEAVYDWADEAWKDVSRPAAPYVPPELSHPDLDELLRLAALSPVFDSASQIAPGAVLGTLIDIAADHNQRFLVNGGGVGSTDLIRLTGKYNDPFRGVYARFARRDDLEAVGKYLFGDGFAWDNSPINDTASACRSVEFPFYLKETSPSSSGDFLTPRELFLSVSDNGETVTLESLPLFVYAGHILTQENCHVPQSYIGYTEDGAFYFYNDMDVNSLPHRIYTFVRADDGHYIIRSCRETNSPGD